MKLFMWESIFYSWLISLKVWGWVMQAGIHKISKASFNIYFNDEEFALQQQAHLDSFIKKRLCPIMEDIFDKHSANGKIFRIDQIEVDLGNIDACSYQIRMEELFRERLEAALKEKLGGIFSGRTEDGNVITAFQSEVEFAEYFLIYGVLPWTGDNRGGFNLDDVVFKALMFGNKKFISFLKKNMLVQDIRRRMVRQFSEKTIEKVLTLLFPSEKSRLVFIEALCLILRDNFFQAKGVAAPQIMIWDLAFDFMCGMENAGKIDEALFLTLIAEQLASHLDIKASDIYEVLIRKLNVKDADVKGRRRFGGLRLQKEAENVSQTLVSALLNAIEFGITTDFNCTWKKIVTEFPEIVRRTILSLGKKSTVRRKIIDLFTEQQIQELVTIIEPEESGFVESFTNNVSALPKDKTILKFDLGRYRKQVWEFVLAYLIVEHDGKFNKKEFVKSVIKSISDHYNLRYTDLLAALKKTFGLLADSYFKSGVLDILLEFETETQTNLDAQAQLKKKILPEDAQFFKAQDSLEILSRYLVTDVGPGQYNSTLEQIILNELLFLKEKRPDYIVRLFKDLQVKPLRCHAFAEKFSENLIIGLIRIFFLIVYGTDEIRFKKFVDAVKKSSKKAGDRKTYYSQILKNMLEGFDIDLEQAVIKSHVTKKSAIVAAKTSEISGPVIEDHQKKYIEYKNEALPFSVRDAEKIVNNLLRKKSSVSAHEIYEFKRAFEFMFKQNPERVYHLFNENLYSKDFSEKLTKILPQRLLLRVLYLFIPKEFQTVTKYTDILINAVYINSSITSDPYLYKDFFQFVFDFARNNVPGPLNKRKFVKEFVVFLYKNSEHTDDTDFFSIVAKGVDAGIRFFDSADSAFVMDIISGMNKKKESSMDIFVKQYESADSGESLDSSTEKVHVEHTPCTEEIWVMNAGLTIAAPYLPQLFSRLHLTGKTGFKSGADAQRGVHLLQYMLNESSHSPEYQLILNKLLCGVKPGKPVIAGVIITEEEKKIINGLITGMIQNWKILGKTSVKGFRESFFMREGKLVLNDDHWELYVEPKPFDMLLDRIPWSFSYIKYSWMDKVVNVNWR